MLQPGETFCIVAASSIANIQKWITSLDALFQYIWIRLECQ